MPHLEEDFNSQEDLFEDSVNTKSKSTNILKLESTADQSSKPVGTESDSSVENYPIIDISPHPKKKISLSRSKLALKTKEVSLRSGLEDRASSGISKDMSTSESEDEVIPGTQNLTSGNSILSSITNYPGFNKPNNSKPASSSSGSESDSTDSQGEDSAPKKVEGAVKTEFNALAVETDSDASSSGDSDSEEDESSGDEKQSSQVKAAAVAVKSETLRSPPLNKTADVSSKPQESSKKSITTKNNSDSATLQTKGVPSPQKASNSNGAVTKMDEESSESGSDEDSSSSQTKNKQSGNSESESEEDESSGGEDKSSHVKAVASVKTETPQSPSLHKTADVSSKPQESPKKSIPTKNRSDSTALETKDVPSPQKSSNSNGAVTKMDDESSESGSDEESSSSQTKNKQSSSSESESEEDESSTGEKKSSQVKAAAVPVKSETLRSPPLNKTADVSPNPQGSSKKLIPTKTSSDSATLRTKGVPSPQKASISNNTVTKIQTKNKLSSSESESEEDESSGGEDKSSKVKAAAVAVKSETLRSPPLNKTVDVNPNPQGSPKKSIPTKTSSDSATLKTKGVSSPQKASISNNTVTKINTKNKQSSSDSESEEDESSGSEDKSSQVKAAAVPVKTETPQSPSLHKTADVSSKPQESPKKSIPTKNRSDSAALQTKSVPPSQKSSNSNGAVTKMNGYSSESGSDEGSSTGSESQSESESDTKPKHKFPEKKNSPVKEAVKVNPSQDAPKQLSSRHQVSSSSGDSGTDSSGSESPAPTAGKTVKPAEKPSTVPSTPNRKRKGDRTSSPSAEETAPSKKVRKLDANSKADPEPFNSTRIPGDTETGFPGNEVSAIQKEGFASPAPCTKTFSKNESKANQRSILEFAQPKLPSKARKIDLLKEEFLEDGYLDISEQIDFESNEGFFEEDFLAEDVEVYVVQCPIEVDPKSIVGQRIDLKSNDTIVRLSYKSGETVSHEVYCDLDESESITTLIAPSKTKKKFTLTSVPIAGRLTFTESVDTPQIPRFNKTTPPPVPFPDNLKPRNSFLDFESSTSSRTAKKRRKAMKIEDSLVEDSESSFVPEKIPKKKKRRDKFPLDESDGPAASEETSQESPKKKVSIELHEMSTQEIERTTPEEKDDSKKFNKSLPVTEEMDTSVLNSSLDKAVEKKHKKKKRKDPPAEEETSTSLIKKDKKKKKKKNREKSSENAEDESSKKRHKKKKSVEI